MRIEQSKGFTLIEVMVAMVIMAIALIAVWGMHFSSLKTDTRNRDESHALFLANQKLEELRSLPFASLVSGADFAQHPFDIEWNVTSPQAWRKDITVVVSWPERIKSLDGEVQDSQRSVRVVTIVADIS